jgi:hypothetical protein
MEKGHHRGENPADRRVTAGEAVTRLIGLRHDGAGAINNDDRSRRSARGLIRRRRSQHVRFAPQSGHRELVPTCPLSANRVLTRRSKKAPLFDHLVDAAERTAHRADAAKSGFQVVYWENASVAARARSSVLTLTSATEPRSTSRWARSNAGRISSGRSTYSP